MEPPVKNMLMTDPEVKRIKFDLFHDLPEGIGTRFEEEKKTIFFRESDSLGILDALSQRLKESSGPGENVVYDLHLVGIMPTEVVSIVASNLRLWDNVKTLCYAAPRKSESLIFETKIFPL